jgi:hypothetical protein
MKKKPYIIRKPLERNHTPRSDKSESGQAIVETTLTMIILCLLLFGLLQVFQIAVAEMITSYSSFYASRSYAVGFSADGNGAPWWRQLVNKAARVRAIPASGKRIFPEGYENEQNVIWRYLTEHNQWLEYEYWRGENDYDYIFYNRDVTPPSTHFSISPNTNTFYMIDMHARFTDYPFPMFDLMDPDRTWFDTVAESRDIKASSEMINHAKDYMIKE